MEFALAQLTVLLLFGFGHSASPCWSGDFSFASCCLVNSAQCWGGAFSYDRCCQQTPLLSVQEVEGIKKLKGQALNCGCSKPDLSHPAFKGGPFTWCKFYQAIMLNQDLRPFYMPFLEVSVKMLAECPLGSFAMLLLDASLKIANTQETPRLNEMPSFLRAQELLQEILDSGISLTEVATSGWMIFNQVSVLRTAVQRRGHGLDVVGTCAQIPPPESLPARMLQTMLEGVSFLPVGAYSILQLFLRDANLVGAKVPLCSFAGPAMHLLVAYSSLQQTAPDQAQLPVPGAPASPKDEAAQMIQLGDEQLRVALAESAATGSTGTVGALALMLVTPWPIPEVLDLLSHPGRVNMEVQTAMEDLLHLEEGHPLWDKAQSGRSSYFFRVNPYREMVSDMVRYTKMPFCGLRPFLRMVADVAKAAMSAGCATPGVYLEDSRTCEFTFVEGGPHLGDCAMWATTVLRLAGVQTRSIAFEPLPDAAALFQQSVLENGLASHVSVQNAALGQSSGTMTELIHFRGHNGQATVNGEDFPSQDRREVVTIQAQQLALDDEIPPSWPHIDALKLSVNGAERNTLAGARKLLSKRRICSVLMHATKCKRGRRPASEDPAPGNVSKFAYDLMMFLEEGNMDVYEHNDAKEGKGRGRVRRLTTAQDMDGIFDDPELTEQVYFLALSKDQNCGRAKRHFNIAAGRPPTAMLEDPGM